VSTQPEDTLESCDALVAELFLAWRVINPEGGEFNGAHLLRFRQLPAKERSYFAALVTPYEDPHWATRTQEVVTEGDRTHVVYTPPYPHSCECVAPVFADQSRQTLRCSRCLHAWPFSRVARLVMETAGVQTRPFLLDPLIDSVNRVDMGYAIERVLCAESEETCPA